MSEGRQSFRQVDEIFGSWVRWSSKRLVWGCEGVFLFWENFMNIEFSVC